MKQCQICYKNICKDEYVELLIQHIENYKYILGKYKWTECNYCFICLNISRKLLWSFYINTLLTTDCKHNLMNLLQNPIPIWITDNLRINGKPIKALHYKNQMYSSQIITGLSDYQLYIFKEKITKIYASLLQSENINTQIDNLQTLLSNININISTHANTNEK
jgi:hypothetical protein